MALILLFLDFSIKVEDWRSERQSSKHQSQKVHQYLQNENMSKNTSFTGQEFHAAHIFSTNVTHPLVFVSLKVSDKFLSTA